MVALSPTDISRCYRHLGFGNGEGIPAGDVGRLNKAVQLVRDSYQRDHLKAILDRCDSAWVKTQLGGSENYESQEIYAGDINRTIRRDRPGEGRRIWWEYYLGCTDELAHELWVPNYWRDENLRYRFSDHGGEFILSVPGPSGEFLATVGDGAPTSTPTQVGQLYFAQLLIPPVLYVSVGTTSSADWKAT